MRRSSRRSTMGVSIHNSLDFDSHTTKITTRRSSSILPHSHEPRNLVGNFTTKFSMSSFVKRVEELTTEQRTAIERVGFGNLLRIHHHTLRKNLLIEWIDRWDCDKRAFVLHGKELTITAMDAALILGLRAAGKSVSLSDDKPLSKLEEDYGATMSNRKISISTIEQRLQSLGDLANEEFTRMFLLFIFGTLLFPSPNSKIDSRYLYLLENLDEVLEYSWGLAVVEDLFSWLSKRKEEQTKGMEGCLILLQIWSYEHTEIGRPNLLRSPLDFPRACRWESSRCNIPRYWFTSKFNELEDSQVTWKLQPTEVELTIDIVIELLMEGALEEETLMTSTNTSTSMTTDLPSKNVLSDNEPEACMGSDIHDQQAYIPENSGLSSEVSSLAERFERPEVLSTRTSTKLTSVTMGLPPKSLSRHAMGDEEPGRGRGRSKLDVPADIQEDSRQSTDVSVMTDEFTECSSSYGVQEGQIAETSHRSKGEQFLKIKESELLELQTIRGKYDMLIGQMIPEFEEVIAKLRREVADLKEDNDRLRAPPPADNIERIINAYFDGVSDPSEVKLFR